MQGIASTLTTWNPGRARVTMPPRAIFTKVNRGASLGEPFDSEQQKRILRATLDLLAQDAPIDPIYLEEGNREQ
jgi:hypothetical protein